jgi:hypothetical protein
MSGRPRGAWSEKRFRDALNLAVNEERKDGLHRLRVIANQLVTAAEGGDMVAIKEVADRLDGRPNQSHDVDVGVNEQLLALIEAGLARTRGAA